MIFDRDFRKPWDEKIWRREEHFGDLRINIWGA